MKVVQRLAIVASTVVAAQVVDATTIDLTLLDALVVVEEDYFSGNDLMVMNGVVYVVKSLLQLKVDDDLLLHQLHS